ncbi:transposase [Microcystis aeruginosa]|uniref:transposase n=1 Tax=Microcystis aeruginosa TaxID=1126 RepID=UPI00352BDB6C
MRKTLTGWGKEVLGPIEEVSIDLWLTYKNLVKELMPSAEVVADRFHVMKQINQELDEQRRDVRRCSVEPQKKEPGQRRKIKNRKRKKKRS